jgi:LmbE family N-acetylglucosaminyl deacetylase
MSSITPGAIFSSLPLVDLEHLTGEHTTMILAPHPDDESLGCGGLIAESCLRGRPPVVVIVTDGTGSHPSSVSFPPARLRELREHEARDAVSALGLPTDRLHFLRLRDGHMPKSGLRYDAAMERLVRLFARCGCKTIAAPWLYDPHCDHEATQKIARALSLKVRARLLSYPVWGWLLSDTANISLRRIIGWRVDIRTHATVKRAAIESHRSQYSNLITDDPDGFKLPAELLAAFNQPYETFLYTRL